MHEAAIDAFPTTACLGTSIDVVVNRNGGTARPTSSSPRYRNLDLRPRKLAPQHEGIRRSLVTPTR